MFVVLKPFDERGRRAEYDAVIAAKLQQQCNQEIEGAIVGVFRAPPIQRPGQRRRLQAADRSSAATSTSTSCKR